MNKSSKLCELLGMEPKYKVVIEGMKKPKPSWVMTGETFESEGAALEYISTIVTPYKKAYPAKFEVDFKRNTNFPRLLELGTKGCTLWWKVNARAILDGSGLPSNMDEFIEKLIKYVPSDKEMQTQIKKESWDY